MNKIIKFFQESYAELRKVTWPTKEEASSNTQLVIIAVIIVALFLGIIDYLLHTVITFLLNI
jgi:preprotein translocase subunit SecE